VAPARKPITAPQRMEGWTMSKSRKAKTSARRDFLKFAALGSVAGAAAVATGGGKAKAEVARNAGAAGYRETEHVKKVYALSRF
jgi:hypothetical protein